MKGVEQLYLSVDPVAEVRAMRRGREPDPLTVALLAEMAGVSAVAFELRGERGLRDVRLLRASLKTRLDLWLAPSIDLVSTAFDVRPNRLTLVPERREDGAPLGGLDAHLLREALKKQVTSLREAEIEVAIRVEPALEQIKALHRCDADVAVLYTGGLGRASTEADRRTELGRITDAATLARRLGMTVAVSGGLDLPRVESLARIPQLDEFHVGHGCIGRAVVRGIEQSVLDFMAAIQRGRRHAY